MIYYLVLQLCMNTRKYTLCIFLFAPPFSRTLKIESENEIKIVKLIP